MADMSPTAIDARLRRVLEASADAARERAWQDEQARRLTAARDARRMAPGVDMSPRAVDRRLREASELLTLCRALAAAGGR